MSSDKAAKSRFNSVDCLLNCWARSQYQSVRTRRLIRFEQTEDRNQFPANLPSPFQANLSALIEERIGRHRVNQITPAERLAIEPVRPVQKNFALTNGTSLALARANKAR